MDITTISMSKKKASEVYEKYLEVVKTRKEEYLEDLKKVYHALRQGKKVIDIYEAFEKTGVNEDGEPKLAISLADQKTVTFVKESGGGGIFVRDGQDFRWYGEKVADVRLPGDTFPEWETNKDDDIKRQFVSTNVPVVPAHLLPTGKLSRYYLLWEVDEWREIAKAKDPFLLRRINANTFIVFAAWDLTPVEQILMRGR